MSHRSHIDSRKSEFPKVATRPTVGGVTISDTGWAGIPRQFTQGPDSFRALTVASRRSKLLLQQGPARGVLGGSSLSTLVCLNLGLLRH